MRGLEGVETSPSARLGLDFGGGEVGDVGDILFLVRAMRQVRIHEHTGVFMCVVTGACARCARAGGSGIFSSTSSSFCFIFSTLLSSFASCLNSFLVFFSHVLAACVVAVFALVLSLVPLLPSAVLLPHSFHLPVAPSHKLPRKFVLVFALCSLPPLPPPSRLPASPQKGGSVSGLWSGGL